MKTMHMSKTLVVAVAVIASSLLATSASARDVHDTSDVTGLVSASDLVENDLFPAWKIQMVVKARTWHRQGWCEIVKHAPAVRVAQKAKACRDLKLAESIHRAFTRTLLASVSPAAASLA